MEKKVKLTLKNVSKGYVVGNSVFSAVNNVSLDVYDNEFRAAAEKPCCST